MEEELLGQQMIIKGTAAHLILKFDGRRKVYKYIISNLLSVGYELVGRTLGR